MFKRIYIEITNICNLKCSFCKGNHRKPMFMTTEQFAYVLNQIKGYTEYIYLHVLGEPLMHPNLDAILDLAYQHNIKVNITTNGHLLKSKLDVINKAKSLRQLNISLHSFNSIDDIRELLDTVDMITNDCYISLRLWNLGSVNHNEKIMELINEHYHTSIKSIDRNYKIHENLYLDADNEFDWPDIKKGVIKTTGKCYGLKAHISILVDGTIVPCCLDADGIIALGNIFKDDLGTVLKSNRCQAMVEGFRQRKLVEPLCQRCGFIKKFDC